MKKQKAVEEKIIAKFRELVNAYGWEGDLADDGKDKFIEQFILKALRSQEERNRLSFEIVALEAMKVELYENKDEFTRGHLHGLKRALYLMGKRDKLKSMKITNSRA